MRTAKLETIRVRDPFILPDPDRGTYFLTQSLANDDPAQRGVGIWTSSDLDTWRGPHPAYVIPDDGWGREAVWAPELHRYNGRYYLFVTFTADIELGPREPDWRPLLKRGTQVLVADSPRGPFQPFRNAAHTDPTIMALDGTLWVEDDTPYMIYCHEWVQLKDGAIVLAEMAPDLSALVGEPQTLFHASEAPWAHDFRDAPGGYVTDGPFLYRTQTGALLMIWSSFGAGGYMTGIAQSTSGSVRGPWIQQPDPLFDKDGGHGMIFSRFDGALMLTLHQPNARGQERAQLIELAEEGDTLRVK